MSPQMPTDEALLAVLRRLRLPAGRAGEPLARQGAADLLEALARFAELLPQDERPAAAADLLDHVADSNALHPWRQERGLPVTVIFSAAVHPSYFTGEQRVGEEPWRLCYTEGGPVGPEPTTGCLPDATTGMGGAH